MISIKKCIGEIKKKSIKDCGRRFITEGKGVGGGGGESLGKCKLTGRDVVLLASIEVE